MSSTNGVISQGVAGDQASGSKYTRQHTIISVHDEEFPSDAINTKFRSLDAAYEDEATGQPLIRKVPSLLRRNKHFQKFLYFDPKVVAIGPLHHDDSNLQTGEALKMKLASHFIKDHGFEKQFLYNKIKMEIGNLRKCYDPKEIEKYNDEELSWMFFLDGCAVLQAIYLQYAPEDFQQKESKKLKIKIDLLTLAYLDFFLLENQIPYRVLDLLTSSSGSQGNEFKELIKRFIDDNVMTPKEMMQQQQQEGKQEKQDDPNQKPGENQQQGKLKNQEDKQTLEEMEKQQKEEPAHLLELLRKRLLDGKGDKRKTGCSAFYHRMIDSLKYSSDKSSHHSHTFRNVKELSAAGIWLKPSDTSCLKDVSFQRICFVGKLWLPPIRVDDSTGPKFMNLIAYEMCPDFHNDFYVTSYICFLDSLIDEAEDVKVLRDAGILHNGLGSDEEVAKLFNKMNTDLVPNPDIYSLVMNQIQNHCDNPWITSAAEAYHTHFTSPWTILAFVGAIVALGLSAVQTYYTIKPAK